MIRVITTGTMILLMPIVSLAGETSGSAYETTVEEDAQVASQACLSGLSPLKDVMSTPQPRVSDEEREAFLEAFDSRVQDYCSCVVRAIPIRSLQPGQIDYIRFLLQHAVEPKDHLQTQALMQRDGLDPDRMAVMTNKWVEWVRYCRL